MSFQNRKQKIVNIVEEMGEASVRELAERTGASGATLRRDLNLMAEEGLVFRTHGGAMKLSLVQPPLGFAQKAARNLDKKDYLCSLAAKEIQDGDTIFMDCGSTVFRLCPYLKNKRIKVVTNSLPVVYELAGSGVSLNLVGGEFDPERQAVHGSMAVEHIRRYHLDKAFLGADGISPQHGLTSRTEKDAEVTLAVLPQAKTVYLLCDSSKVNQPSYLQFADFQHVDVLVTDAQDAAVADYRALVGRVLN